MAGDKNKLTEKQRQILEYLKQEILQRGFPPSVREICEAVSLRSTSSVHAHLETLERKGISNEMQQNREPLKFCDEGFHTGRLVQSRELHRKTPHPRVRLHRFR
mgnify:CR=1 FL=1